MKSGNKPVLKKIAQLLESVSKTPYEGIGKPEPLKYSLIGCWSRRIDQEHRIIYEVHPYKIVVLSLKGCIFVKGHVINWNKLNDPKWKEYFNRFMKIYYMETVFKLNAKELDMSFIDSIRNLFKDHDIEISIKQVEDETEYLLKSPENKKNILEAITDVKKNKNLIRFTAQEFEELTEKLMNS